jgi:colanic acid/amylovoran biosynthesis glycosyltransferase
MPRVVCYCQDFLKADMQHVYRQITSLHEWQPRILTQKRENREIFPVPREKDIAVLPPEPWKNARRWWYQNVRREPRAISHTRVVKLLHEVERLEGDVVHIFFGHIAVLLRPFIAASPRPVVVSFHGADVGVDVRNAAHLAALQVIFKKAALVMARSQSLLDGLRAIGCPAEKLRLQRTGLDLTAWPFRERQPPADEAWQFIQSGRFVPKKGFKTTLRAFAQIVERHPNARLTLVGDGPLRVEIERFAGDLGLDHVVDFPGFLDQAALRSMMDQAHFFFHPSETPPDGNCEGVPNAMLEAMALGLPILATTHGGIPEAVTHGHSGHLVPEHEADALAQGTLELMADPTRYTAMGTGARADVVAKFERQRQTQILEAYYTEALARPER